MLLIARAPSLLRTTKKMQKNKRKRKTNGSRAIYCWLPRAKRGGSSFGPAKVFIAARTKRERERERGGEGEGDRQRENGRRNTPTIRHSPASFPRRVPELAGRLFIKKNYALEIA